MTDYWLVPLLFASPPVFSLCFFRDVYVTVIVCVILIVVIWGVCILLSQFIFIVVVVVVVGKLVRLIVLLGLALVLLGVTLNNL
jgi:hypothetical protein